MEGVQAFAVDRAVDEPSRAASPNQLSSTEHPEMPAEGGLAQIERVGELLDRDLLDAREILQDLQSRDAAERLVMGAQLAKRRL
jgi:hypothetical protein